MATARLISFETQSNKTVLTQIDTNAAHFGLKFYSDISLKIINPPPPQLPTIKRNKQNFAPGNLDLATDIPSGDGIPENGSNGKCHVTVPHVF
ncbi:Hypothetical predicted protein [Podarcis lilfordi]|uniref:Uncharacterized protein n=1 Tax=Podarcis lilfordi TaxID=74358 RepID=A0AA35LB79_9SAUR|nr:Hypothetical predicted protein [Podarcis lilfordi]